ncbi:MAG: NTP transferase domain-containing protein [Actinobacteria bacterium]|nr:NTP transferase domain-containing protein [Actinomycetota bacterium]
MAGDSPNLRSHLPTPAEVISGIILAAGSSKRLGRPKQLLDLEGRPLLQHVVDAAAGAGLQEIVVVLGHDAERIAAALVLPSSARAVVNPDHSAGQSTSLRTGLDALDPGAEAAAILLGDQPRLGASAIIRVIDGFRSGPSPIARAMWRGVPGHPVVVARSEWDRFRGSEGDVGARHVISASREVAEIEMDEAPPVDVDTWEQYETVRTDR